MENFNKHAAAVAMMSDLLVQNIKTDYAEGAFIAGLLHDMGRLLIVMGLPEEYSVIFARHRATGEPFVFCEQEILGFNHAELSADAMNTWKLPTEIRLAVAHHHNPAHIAGGNIPQRPDGQPIPLARILQAADAYVNGLGLAIVNDPRLDDPALALAGLPLSEATLAKVIKQFDAEHTAIAHFYQ
jgi:hypothetical protein